MLKQKKTAVREEEQEFKAYLQEARQQKSLDLQQLKMLNTLNDSEAPLSNLISNYFNY